MQAAMDRLTALLERRRWIVLGAWVLLLVAAAPFAARQTENLTSGGFTVPGSGSDRVDQALAGFEGAQRESLAVVVARRPGGSVESVRSAIDRADAAAARLPGVELSDRAEAAAKRQAGRSPISIAVLDVTGDRNEAADVAYDLRQDVGAGEGPVDGAETYLVGQQALWAGMQDLSKEDLEAAEVTGFPIVLLILLAVFGSLAAASLPLALGFVSVLITGALIFFLSQSLEMSVFTTNVASMIGIGVAVDYSLFVLARYREEIRAGASPEAARRASMRTSGLAVAFSGVTVMVSLAGLFLVDSTTIRSMALGAIVVVAISILAALTFLPVLMRVMGRRAYTRGRPALVVALLARNVRWRRRRRGSTAPGSSTGGFWQRWTDRVTRRPVLAAVLSAGVLVVLAIPALSLQFGDGALRQFPEGNDTRVGAELAAGELGAGATGPTQIVARFDTGTASAADNRAALADYGAALRRDLEVVDVARPVSSEAGGAALIMVAVFAVFAGTGVPSIKEIGLGLSVAIALDATLVRLVLVPATMEIMGRWNWWLPAPIARVLPEASFEASGAADSSAAHA